MLILVTSTSGIRKPENLATACRTAIQNAPGGERSHRPASSSRADKARTKEIICGHNSHTEMQFVAGTSVSGFSHRACCMPWQSSLRGHCGERQPCFPWLLPFPSSPHLITPTLYSEILGKVRKKSSPEVTGRDLWLSLALLSSPECTFALP